MNEIINKSTLLNEYKIVITNYKKALEEKKTLLNKQKEEMDAITEKFHLPLKNSEQNIKDTLQAVHNFKDMLMDYSTFNESMISNAICLLIHIVEEQNFQYQKAQYYIGYLFHGLWGGQGEERFNLWKIKLIINEKKRKEEYYWPLYDKDEVMELVNNGNAILLQKVEYSIPKKDGKIIFYFLDNNHNITCSSDFGRFDYVKNFIDFIIQYRFSHNLKEVSKDDIVLCMQLFLQNNKDFILSNYFSRVQSRILEIPN